MKPHEHQGIAKRSSVSSWGISQEFWFITNPDYFSSLCLAKSCSDLKRIEPRAESGSYVIDLDGEGGLLPMYDVLCNMTDQNGIGVTVISHDSENRTLVKGQKAKVPTRVTFITQERVCLSWRVLPESLYTVNSLSSMSVIIRYYFTEDTDGGCRVVMIR